jgi:hypothetical protein
MGDYCGPELAKRKETGISEICNSRAFPVPPAIFDENGAHRNLGLNGSLKIGDASHLA